MEFVNVNSCNEWLEQEYQNLIIGDIIWAKRYNNEYSMSLIPEGHKDGPFIVIGRYEKRLKCLYCSSVFPKEIICDYQIFELIDPQYSLNKGSYVYVTKNSYMAKSRFIKKIGHLNEEEKKLLFKKLGIAKMKGMNVEMEIDIPEIPLESGDIVKKNNKFYLIIDINKENYFCIKMIKDNCSNLDFYIIADGIEWYLDFSSVREINKDDFLVRKNFIDNMTLKKVLAMYKRSIEQNNQKNDVSRGSLIQMNGVRYYIYGEIGSEWMAFPVIGQNYKYNIIIDGKNYYADFKNSIQISKNQIGIKILTHALDKEMNEIKKVKKSYQKSVEDTGKKMKKDYIDVGSIVRYTMIEDDELYVVIVKDGLELVALKYDDYLNGKYTLKKLFAHKVYAVDCIEILNLRQVLLDIRDIADGYINKKRLKRMINNC